ncbi:MAG: leucyl aminopeptidase [Gammaproteobacteria bacterium]|nr:leucyl aminopeptidase [Gammaproteobacteria bacterium]
MSIILDRKLPTTFSILETDANKKAADCLILGVSHGNKLIPSSLKLTKSALSFLQTHLKLSNFEAKIGQVLMLYGVPDVKASSALIVGCGKLNELDEAHYKSIYVHMLKALTAARIKTAICSLNQLAIKARDVEWGTHFAIETICNELYDFAYFKSKVEKAKLAEIQFVVPSKEQRKQSQFIEQAQIIAEATRFAKDLGNLPANICTPSYMARQALSFKALSKKVKVEILDREKLQEIGANCILAVAQGSAEPCQFITMHYQGGKKNEAPTVLVGKGVSFDTGGICIKTRDNMNMMKMDMCGAATVMAVFAAAVKLNLPINLIAVAPCVENMPDGKAYRPGDIIRSLSGQTIEVLDTDAEGRLILCDALTYCERFEPACVIDVATLTGAIVVALGQHYTGLYGNNDPLIHALLKAGKQSDDLAWQMPISDEYQKQIDSKIADMANLGGPYGGSITAACFLARFTKKYHWAHLDVAGTAMSKDGARGRPVGLLIQYLLTKVE